MADLHDDEFKYQWWLFDDMHSAEEVKNHMRCPAVLEAHHKGQKVAGPPSGLGLPDGSAVKGIDLNHKRVSSSSFEDSHDFSGTDLAGKVLGLGACRIAEVAPGSDVMSADGLWKWDLKMLKHGQAELDIEVNFDGKTYTPFDVKLDISDSVGNKAPAVVHVPEGDNPVGIAKLKIAPGKYRITQQDLPEFSGVIPASGFFDINILPGKENKVVFRDLLAQGKIKLECHVLGELKDDLEVTYLIKGPGLNHHFKLDLKAGKDSVGQLTIVAFEGLFHIEQQEKEGLHVLNSSGDPDPAMKNQRIAVENRKETVVKFINRFDPGESE